MIMEQDIGSLEQRFENMVKKIGQLANESKKEQLSIDLLEQEIEDRRRDIEEFRRRQDNFGFVEHELSLIKSIITEEEAHYLQRKREERENVRTVSFQRERELEDKKKAIKDAEGEIREMQVRLEENELKRQGLERKVVFKAEKIEKIVTDIEIENKTLKELNEAVLQRSEDVQVIKDHEELTFQRDSKVKELARLTEKQNSMEDKLREIKHCLEKIEEDLREARENKERRTGELQQLQIKRENIDKYSDVLQLELSELENLDTEITQINYYISKAELKLMEYRKANRDRLNGRGRSTKLNDLQQELMTLPTNTYTHSAKDKINSSVKTIVEKIKSINLK